MIGKRLVVPVLALIVLGFVAIGVLYALNTPPWQAPDEPAHYNYVAQVAKSGCCPVLAPGDWDQAALGDLVSAGFPPGADVSRLQYEDHQPPLFYVIGSLAFTLSGGSLLVLRLLSLAFGAGAVIASYVAVARVFPRLPQLALGAAAFVAFLPQFIAISASANNDSLAVLVVSMLAVVAMTYLGNPTWLDPQGAVQPYDESSRPHAAALGGFTGVAFLTKLTIYLPAAVIAGLAILLRWRIEKRSPGWLAQQIGWSAGMALAFGLPWWVRDVTVYGWPDIVGLGRHDAVVVGQPRTAELLSRVGTAEYVREYASTVYHSTLGQFGWMGVPMPPPFYLGIGLFLIFALAGLIVLAARRRAGPGLCPPQRAALWILAGLMAATLFGLVDYNLTFVQFQGRYLFPMLIPLALGVAAGLWGWASLAGRWTRRLTWLPVVALVWMPGLALWALYRFVIPNLK
jgi:4-amino-4-deoxy-L-arabinose transferase-like glycosyltransferase